MKFQAADIHFHHRQSYSSCLKKAKYRPSQSYNIISEDEIRQSGRKMVGKFQVLLFDTKHKHAFTN